MSDVHVRIRVAGEEYALPVGDVIEVVETGDVTPVPGGTRSAVGVRNLRGQILPVFDLAGVLGLQAAAGTRVVVAGNGAQRVGLLVDAVVDVDVLPDSGETVDSVLLSGAVLVDGALVGVLDLVAVLRGLEAELVP